MKNMLKLVLAAALVLGYGRAYAFHSGGVAECGGCHQMHDAATNYSLLIAADASSTCLSCHENAGDTGPSSYHISTAAAALSPTAPPKQRTPGGDFAWLKRSYADTAIGYNEPGDRHGHNIVSVAKGYTADATNTTAPGSAGAVSATNLACNSCHDQHSSIRRFADGSYARTGLPIAGSGSYDNSAAPIAGKTAMGTYRILRGGGSFGNDTFVPGATFTSLFVAVAPSSYNRTEALTDTRVAYGQGVGVWCATCHPDMHTNPAPAGNYHPVDAGLGATIQNNYATYISSGIMTGVSASSFTSLVPFAENTQVVSSLQPHAKNNNSYMTGPAASDQVTCVSCHRAHASGFMDMLRWQPENEFLTKADSLGNGFYCATDSPVSSGRCALGRTTVEVQAAYYDRPISKWGIWQRSLCNKCHAKD